MAEDRAAEQVGPASRGRGVRAFLASTAALSLLVGLFGAVSYASWVEAQKGIGHIPPSPGSSSGYDFGPCVRNVCNYLVLGSDSRAGLSASQQRNFGTNKDIGGSNRSDVIMLVHTDPTRKKAVIVSFPRDLWVHIPGHGMNKINAAFEGGLNHGGPQLVARTVEDLVGLHINHVLYVDLAGFEGIVQALGGVDMCIPSNLVNTPGWLEQDSATGSTQVYYGETGHIVDPNTGLDVKPGCQRLSGLQALAYVRTRHLRCDTVGDFSRIGRQQQFLRAVLNRLLQPSEIARVPTLIGPVARNLVTDPGFKLADIIYLVKQLQGISSGAADFRAVPGNASAMVTPPWSPDPLSIVRMDPKARDLFRALKDGKPLPPVGLQLQRTPISPANISVPVVEHSSAGASAQVEKVLSDSGFDIAPGIVGYSEFGAPVKGSVIAYEPGHLEEAKVVAQYLPNLKLVAAPRRSLRGSPVAVFVSSSYRPQPFGGSSQPAQSCVAPTG